MNLLFVIDFRLYVTKTGQNSHTKTEAVEMRREYFDISDADYW